MTVVEYEELRNREGVFADRSEAGDKLAGLLDGYRDTDTVVLAIPAGGVPVAVEIGRIVGLPVDVAVVSKPTLPWTTEAGFGAVAFDGTVRLNEPLVRSTGMTKQEVDDAVKAAKIKVERRVEDLRGGRPLPELAGKSVILVDDGLASGFTMRVAVEAVSHANPASIVVAVPTAHDSSLAMLEPMVGAIYCCNVRGGMRFAVASAYRRWYDVPEEEAARLLADSAK
jgi:predicted phosphoribosyltransferase